MKLFKTYNEWREEYESQFSYLFSDVTMFDGIGYTYTMLEEYYSLYYGYRYLSVPYNPDSVVNNNIQIEKIKKIIKHFSLTNEYKYRTLIKTLNLEYNPIENYNMKENANDTTTYGENEFTHRNNDNLLAGQDGVDKVWEEPSSDYKKEISENNPTVTETVDYGSPNSANAYSIERKTTPYNDNNNYVNHDKDVHTGTIETTTSVSAGKTSTETQTGTLTTNQKLTSMYTDKTAEHSDGTTHSLTRSGNIGVTTTQQMIEQERNVARFNIIKEFCDELSQFIVLGVL